MHPDHLWFGDYYVVNRSSGHLWIEVQLSRQYQSDFFQHTTTMRQAFHRHLGRTRMPLLLLLLFLLSLSLEFKGNILRIFRLKISKILILNKPPKPEDLIQFFPQIIGLVNSNSPLYQFIYISQYRLIKYFY